MASCNSQFLNEPLFFKLPVNHQATKYDVDEKLFNDESTVLNTDSLSG